MKYLSLFSSQNLLKSEQTSGENRMAGFGNDDIVITVTLTQEERFCILEYCHQMSHTLLDKVGLAENGTLPLTEREADTLKLYLCNAAYRIPDQDLISTIKGLLNKIYPGLEIQPFLDNIPDW